MPGTSNSGRRRKPTVLKILHGNPGKENLKKKMEQEPQPNIPSEIPVPSKDLTGDNIARKKWKELSPKLYDLGLLTELDLDVLSLYCIAYSEWLKAKKDVLKNGYQIDTVDGKGKKISPSVNIRDKAEKKMEIYMARLGLTPSDRSRLNIKPPEKKSEFEKFLDR